MSPKFGFTMLGSGSGGNASVVHGPEGNILLDEGFSGVELKRRMDRAGIKPASIQAIIITHAHGDHVNRCGCATFANHLGIPTYLVPEAIPELQKKKINVPEQTVLFQPGSGFDLCGVHIESFAVSHDVTAVGFAFTVPGRKIGYATDLGFISELAKVRLNGCDLLVLESNYDTKMLRMSKRRLQTKRRIAGNFGHLGNVQAMIALEELLAPNTKHLILAHISGECNDPEILKPLAEARLAELNRQDISFCLASQSDPLDTICIEE